MDAHPRVGFKMSPHGFPLFSATRRYFRLFFILFSLIPLEWSVALVPPPPFASLKIFRFFCPLLTGQLGGFFLLPQYWPPLTWLFHLPVAVVPSTISSDSSFPDALINILSRFP